MNEYIKMLSNHLFQTYNIQTDRIKLHSQIEELKLHTDTAIPLGMILNELISNSLKYAFPKEEVHTAKNNGYIWIKMEKNGSELLLQVKDNGIGLPGDFDIDKTTSFGYEIIKAFSQKLKARIKIDGSSGTDVQIIISKFKTIENI
jgi:two-component sensor histidine kinase